MKVGMITTLLAASCTAGVCATVLAQKSVAAQETTIATANTTEALTFVAGASIRISDPTGIRFTATLDESLKDSVYTVTEEVVDVVEGVELGMIIVPAQALAGVGNYDVFEYLETTYGKTKAQVSTQFNTDGGTGKIVRNEEDTAYIIQGAIVDVQDVNFNYTYQAVAYYKLANGSYVYSKTMSTTRTIPYVADAALRLADNLTPNSMTVLTDIVKKAYTLKNGADYTATVSVGGTLDLTTILPETESAGNYIFELTDGSESVTLENGTVTAVSLGDAVVTTYITAYNGTKIEIAKIPVKATVEKKSVETEVSDGLDLAATIGEAVASATLDGEAVTVTDGKVTLAIEDAGMDKVYSVTGASGKLYEVTADVWSLIIDDVTELQSMNNYVFTPNVDRPNDRTGYFKLNSDIDMTDVSWTTTETLAPDLEFIGVFDGNNKTISNFNTSTALISRMYGATVKNINITNSSVATNGRQGFLVGLVYFGTFENISINASHTTDGGKATEAPGMLFGQIYGSSAYGNLNLNNVKIIAADAKSWSYASAFGCVPNTSLDLSAALYLNNVVVAGFNVIAYKNGVLKTTEEVEANFTNCENVRIYEDYYDYAVGEMNATELPAKEYELSAVTVDETTTYQVTVDFSSFVAETETVKTVLMNGAAIEGTSKTFAQTETSNKAHGFVIETTDGKLYAVKVTVWSQLIDEADDLFASNSYGYLSNGAFYGYFKLTENIDMSTASATWAQTNRLGQGSTKNSNSGGFQGVFEGNGKTISNFKVANSETALFYAMGQNGVIRNVTFDKATNSSLNSSAIVVAVASGGLVENVTINMTKMPQGYAVNNSGAIIFGRMNGYGAVTTIRNVTVTCATENTMYGTANGGQYEFSTVIGQYTATANKILVDGLTITGIVDTNVISDTAKTVGVSSTKTYTTSGDARTCTVVEESVLFNYITLGEGGLTINGTKITA